MVEVSLIQVQGPGDRVKWCTKSVGSHKNIGELFTNVFEFCCVLWFQVGEELKIVKSFC